MINMRHAILLFICAIGIFGQIGQICSMIISTLDNNDPLPLYYTHPPHSYLTEQIKRSLRQPCIDQPCYDPYPPFNRFLFSIGGFHQKATRGRNFEKQRVPLGDIAGRWNMLGMLYGPVPPGFTLVDTQLGFAKQIIFSDIPEVVMDPNFPIPERDVLEDPHKLLGFFSVPIKYQKAGFRFALEFALLPCGELGLGIYGGAATIKQTVSTFIDLTTEDVTSCERTQICPDTPTTCLIVPDGFLDLTPTGSRICNIQNQLMFPDKADLIFRQIGLDPCDVKQMSWEDMHFVLWWRQLFRINDCGDSCYPGFSIMPFAQFEVTVPLSEKKDRTKLFSLPFGNDSHWAVGGMLGFAIDFYETLEIGFAGGITHFFAADFHNFRVPTHHTQSGIFPFFTDVRRQPGRNIRFDAHLTAYHFLCLLTGWVQYSYICHNEDEIRLKNPADIPFYKPEVLECVTKWESQVLNTGATYDISPNIALGVVVQWPLMQRNAYRSTTILGTIQVQF